jgi:hypothetical protein
MIDLMACSFSTINPKSRVTLSNFAKSNDDVLRQEVEDFYVVDGGTKVEQGCHNLKEENFLYQMVVIGVPKMVREATFIHLNVTTQSTFSTEENNKTGAEDVSRNLFNEI